MEALGFWGYGFWGLGFLIGVWLPLGPLFVLIVLLEDLIVKATVCFVKCLLEQWPCSQDSQPEHIQTYCDIPLLMFMIYFPFGQVVLLKLPIIFFQWTHGPQSRANHNLYNY